MTAAQWRQVRFQYRAACPVCRGRGVALVHRGVRQWTRTCQACMQFVRRWLREDEAGCLRL